MIRSSHTRAPEGCTDPKVSCQRFVDVRIVLVVFVIPMIKHYAGGDNIDVIEKKKLFTTPYIILFIRYATNVHHLISQLFENNIINCGI